MGLRPVQNLSACTRVTFTFTFHPHEGWYKDLFHPPTMRSDEYTAICIPTYLCPGIESRWRRDFRHLSRPGPGAHPASCTMGTGSFLGVKSGRGVTLTPHPFLVLCSWKRRAIPLLPLWAVRSVQSFSACTRVHFTFSFTLYYMQFWQNVIYSIAVIPCVCCAKYLRVIAMLLLVFLNLLFSPPCTSRMIHRTLLTTWK